MAKPKTTFINAFEPILIKAWGSYHDHLDDNLLNKTRDALAYIRRVYRFKGERGAESPSHIDYREAKNRAGYLAAFGERHAYLAYSHLKKVKQVDPFAIPIPNAQGELIVTLVGAGPAIEAYGLCLFLMKILTK